MTDLDLDHLRGWIGRTETAQDQLTPALADRFRATFDLAPAADAPPMIHLCLAPPAAPTAALGPDGHPARGGFLPPVPLPLRMWAVKLFFMRPCRRAIRSAPSTRRPCCCSAIRR